MKMLRQAIHRRVTILVAHGFNLSAATQVTITNGAGSFELVATVPPEEWPTLQSSR